AHSLLVRDFPDVDSLTRSRSHGVTSFPRLSIPFSWDSCTACSTASCNSFPIAVYDSGIGAPNNTPLVIPKRHWVTWSPKFSGVPMIRPHRPHTKNICSRNRIIHTPWALDIKKSGYIVNEHSSN